MSRNSKNRRKLEVAHSFSSLRKNGGRGPHRTQKLHKKKNCWYLTGDRVKVVTRTILETPVEQLVATEQPAEAAA